LNLYKVFYLFAHKIIININSFNYKNTYLNKFYLKENIMKPIILQGHSRPIKDIKFNREGDLLFTGSNDRLVTLWNAETGERVGTYSHEAAVNNMAISKDSKTLISGDATGSCYLWELQTGKLLKKITLDVTESIRSVELSYGDEYVSLSISGRMRDSKSQINIYKVSDVLGSSKAIEPLKSFVSAKSKFVNTKWLNINKNILGSREDGSLVMIDYTSGDVILEKQLHSATFMDLDVSPREEIILTASKDGKSLVVDPDTFDIIHTFYPKNPERNINTAKISPLFSMDDENEEKYHAFIAGGIESRNVTTSTEGGFETLIFNVMYGDELGAIPGHFGPVNTLAIGPNGKVFCTGAEDATIRLQKLEEDYFNLP
jgi:translation initiation factor 3 subunit I